MATVFATSAYVKDDAGDESDSVLECALTKTIIYMVLGFIVTTGQMVPVRVFRFFRMQSFKIDAVGCSSLQFRSSSSPSLL